MNQALELQNNQIIFRRALSMVQRRFGLLTEDMIKNIRKVTLKSSWIIEAKHFRSKRECLNLSQAEVAEDLNISLADLRKLEKGVDFMNRDAIANQLKNYLQLQIN
jgi:DNA-binding transcriptional regulator YiaG